MLGDMLRVSLKNLFRKKQIEAQKEAGKEVVGDGFEVANGFELLYKKQYNIRDKVVNVRQDYQQGIYPIKKLNPFKEKHKKPRKSILTE